MREIGVLGAGSWGTALAIQAARAGCTVKLWARDASLAERMRGERENAKYLPGASLPESIEITSDLGSLCDLDEVMVVIPSHGFRSVVEGFLDRRRSAEPVTLAIK